MEWIGIAIAIAVVVAVVVYQWLKWKRSQRQAVAKAPDRAEYSLTEAPQKNFDPMPSKETFPSTSPQFRVVEKKDEYAKLREWLAKKKYEEADRETWRLMLRIADAHKRGYFELEDFEKFPSNALREIDRLWLDSSEGRFGLSVQKRIYHEVGEEYSQLGIRVGWVRRGKWLAPEDENNDLDFPEGYRPYIMWQSQLVSFGFLGLGMCVEVFFSRSDF